MTMQWSPWVFNFLYQQLFLYHPQPNSNLQFMLLFFFLANEYIQNSLNPWLFSLGYIAGGTIFVIIIEPHQTLQHHESQSIGNCLDDKIE